jgi:hypothetical protein
MTLQNRTTSDATMRRKAFHRIARRDLHGMEVGGEVNTFIEKKRSHRVVEIKNISPRKLRILQRR